MSTYPGEVVVVREAWTSRWYAPLLGLAGGLLASLILALALVQILISGRPSPVAPQAWRVPLDEAEQALQRGDHVAALSAWSQARAAALRSQHWEGLLAVGDASRLFGAQGRARAREAYLTALLRARRDHALDGVLRAATGFAELGDREVLAYALRLADREAGRDPLMHAQVRAVAARWMRPPLEAGHRDSTPSGGRHP
jgi:hypothetical protein